MLYVQTVASALLLSSIVPFASQADPRRGFSPADRDLDDITAPDGPSAAPPLCGNDEVDPGEVCDGNSLMCDDIDPDVFASDQSACKGNCKAVDIGSCTSGDCCTTHEKFCEVHAIRQCVCAFDKFCCQTAWDSLCVDEAIAECSAVC
jgi:hypothetical protein